MVPSITKMQTAGRSAGVAVTSLLPVANPRVRVPAWRSKDKTGITVLASSRRSGCTVTAPRIAKVVTGLPVITRATAVGEGIVVTFSPSLRTHGNQSRLFLIPGFQSHPLLQSLCPGSQSQSDSIPGNRSHFLLSS